VKILFCASELVPFAKTGGLADVAGALPLEIERLGHEVRITLPRYKMVECDKDFATIGKDIKVHFIRNDKLYMRDGIYGNSKGAHPDNLERFVFYCRQSLDLMKKEGFRPDIIHCNDWQTGLIPVYLKSVCQKDPFFKDIKTVFTIHNLAYIGSFPNKEFRKTGLDKALLSSKGLEYYNKTFSLLKGGILFSDILTTVSPTYAKEIQTQAYGCGMEDLLIERDKDLYGILNGIDLNIWDPAKDNKIYKKYSAASIEGKAENKKGLIQESGLKISSDTLLMGAVGRLTHQKGYDLLADIFGEVSKIGVAFILLGTGEEKYHRIFKRMAKKYKKNTAIHLFFDAILAEKIYAGSDVFLMPSRYEPCGLGQLISFKYATVPIANKTGGLADTVLEYDPATGDGNGFVFYGSDPKRFLDAIKRAVFAYRDKPKWKGLITKIAGYDFSWNKSAREYCNLYEKLK